MASQVFLQLFVFALFIIDVHGWKCAKYQNYFSQQPDYIDCLWDCCGNSFNRHCCAPIGIIVGCCIVGAVAVAALTVLMLCWWQRRRAKSAQGPRLFHNQRHSHYPVAPTSVTRPALMVGYTGSDSDQGYKRPPPDNEYSQPPRTGYRPGPQQGYRPPQMSEKPPIDDFYDDRPPQGYRPGPPSQGYRPGPPRPYQASDRSEKLPLDTHSDERAIDI